MSYTAYIALGSNIGCRAQHLHRAIALLNEQVGRVEQCSTFIATAPADMDSQNSFLNAVVRVATRHEPLALLSLTEEIERAMGRDRKSENGQHFDRIIDLDLLLLHPVGAPHEQLYVDEPRLTLPHPRAAERLFVVWPLYELAGTTPITLANGQRLSAAYAELQGEWIERADGSERHYEAVAQLLQAFSPERQLTFAAYAQLAHDNAQLLLLCTPQGVAGMLTLFINRCLTGTKAWVEDVVVLEEHRGKGFGRMLLRQAIATARWEGADKLLLTSRPARKAARALYESEGFRPRDTTLYALDL